MTVKKDKVVEMHYTLKNDVGDVLDSSKGQAPMPFLQGHGNIIPGLEKAVEGMKAGESCDVSVEPAEAYGDLHSEAIQEIPKEALQGIDNLVVGMELQSQDEQGNSLIVRVTAINKDSVTIDANHPLAGQTLSFSVSIESVRDATKEELEHGHIHAHGGSCSH
ncbi:FKBP-type peptidyl-prolyl cis-trans isomerase [bacterium endosymbiont of Bathymodiolus sp. 5 South]|jgi:FKBP-type peptidyl-prolyl cis-trans isomerase SlyD|uniref:FKBP-type peptidyl-prolyl cis-trans isomerase n=1 Tax=bacterium endosymbiont of Bathymodiolus sp. 5 South TaxID=1181670 RepID=UPI0010B4780B|nr:peptidylprolyl isomerase [bacterium endosymbiont of Bathymodiolus sp. 5 South]CAC9654644.1 FKBP-type peptidyl-prolyl cis-trans isomerase SlyD (EC 5.2.1.8) [uncultured Gammaproteobacteria bacterium]SHN91957.1 FKBP-type peptidyl-prolyl cis-trans isomerase SlyD [bacterium endosymbiont of Bathymodiolus sp. 5 South]SSC08969.1 FKBP-type peptidyl-prolyl cis-trans isomerase SlyD [bacterium endosymbiont of Bathymodiolus sp. 5 South]VVH57245.1 FKBP-type peptidyl-prolyl cis-trans isomerase SlyD (EC [un